MRARDNPFAVHRIHALRFRLTEDGWCELLARLRAVDMRAAIVGPEGAGKTLLLEELDARLGALGLAPRLLTLRRGERRPVPAARAALLAGLGAGDVVLVDGADELGPLAWSSLRRAARAAGGLVVTSHRPGLLPTLWTCRTSPELLADLVQELVGGEEADALRPRLAILFDRHRGDLRGALRALYDLYGALPATAGLPRGA
jgi:hypothetical protein